MSGKIFRAGVVSVFLFACLLQAQDNPYQFYKEKLDFAFLKDIELKVEYARQKRDASSLCVYAATLFYAEHLSGQRYVKLDGITVLREATLIAWQDEDVQSLMAARAVWASRLFGPDNPSAAEAIDRFLQDLAKKAEHPEEPSWQDPQLFLMAEEQGRLDAISQVAEQVFGVMIESMTEVKDLSTERDVVIAKLENNLLIGAKFGDTEVRGNEVRVPVTVSRAAIIGAMKQALLAQNKKMSKSEEARLEQSLKSEYRAVGVGIISEE